MTAFEILAEVKKVRDRMGSDVAVANALGFAASGHIPQMLAKMQAPTKWHPHTETCVRIAVLIGRSPREVLEAVGQADVADTLERYYGEERARPAAPVTPIPAEILPVVANWEYLDPHCRAIARVLADVATSFRSAPRRGQRQSLGLAPSKDVSDLLSSESVVGRDAAQQPADRPRTGPRRATKAR